MILLISDCAATVKVTLHDKLSFLKHLNIGRNVLDLLRLLGNKRSSEKLKLIGAIIFNVLIKKTDCYHITLLSNFNAAYLGF